MAKRGQKCNTIIIITKIIWIPKRKKQKTKNRSPLLIKHIICKTGNNHTGVTTDKWNKELL